MRKYSLKFWIIFWTLSVIFLAGWFLYWNIKNKGIAWAASGVVNILPIPAQQKQKYQALANIGDFFLKNDGQEKTLLVLFQNNLEIRPGGGFIGAFGIIKIKNGKIIFIETNDLSNFDARIPNTIMPPYPMKEISYVDFWKLRDSNFSPDFAVNAQKAEDFYYMGDGREKFDGVIGITTNVLTSILKITGPVQIEGYPGTYDSNNAILSLEYQVEKAFEQQGINRGERKSIMGDLAKEIEKRVFSFHATQKIELAKVLLDDLNKKDIQLQFTDSNLQKITTNAQWTGKVDDTWSKDYLMTSDANLGAFKSDYYVKRSIDYTADYSKEIPVAHLKITYQHTATKADWMTKDYLTFLRVYVPQGSFLTDANNFDNPQYGNEFGKKYFGAIVKVSIGTSKTVEINYTLPKLIGDNYDLKIQKQAGINDVPLSVHIIKTDGTSESFSTQLNRDLTLNQFYKK